MSSYLTCSHLTATTGTCWLLYIFSLLEKDDHGVANVETNVAAVVVSYGVATLLNYEAVPVALVLSVEFFFNFSRNV